MSKFFGWLFALGGGGFVWLSVYFSLTRWLPCEQLDWEWSCSRWWAGPTLFFGPIVAGFAAGRGVLAWFGVEDEFV